MDILPLAATLYAAGYALVLRRGTLYALRGRAMLRAPSLEVAATAVHPSRWGRA